MVYPDESLDEVVPTFDPTNIPTEPPPVDSVDPTVVPAPIGTLLTGGL